MGRPKKIIICVNPYCDNIVMGANKRKVYCKACAEMRRIAYISGYQAAKNKSIEDRKKENNYKWCE